jgi:hypothetical protein
METDSLELVNLWKHRATQRSEFGQIPQDIQDLASSFASFSVMYARRTANRAAHACAQFAASSLFEVWTNVPPSFLQQILQGLFGKWRIQVDGRGLKGILGNFDL